MEHDLVVEFRKYVSSSSVEGRNGRDVAVQYISLSKLDTYWTESTIRAVLQACNPILQENIPQIRKEFIRVFSVLVYIGQPREIGLFTRCGFDDHRLPFVDAPSDWPPKLPFYDEFANHQWMFCPLVFTEDYIHKRHLPLRQILPVTYVKQLKQEGCDGGVAIVWQVDIHECCNRLVPEGTSVVFKVYQTYDVKDLYANEANVYNSLPKSAWNHIVRYYGSFSCEETQKRTIILEHAPNGNLLDFFQKSRMPNDLDEIELFWSRMLCILDGLHVVHNPPRPEGVADWFLSGVHQDIQPANILVFPGSSGLDYDFHLKLADFGTANLRKRLVGPKGVMAVENEGNRMYTAPECYGHFSIQDDVRQQVNSNTDVWALGAVFSDALIWTIWGEAGREKYRIRRMGEISDEGLLSGSGFDACFHDGNDRLRAVESTHTDALRQRRASDIVSPCISNLILDCMLVQDQGRSQAMQTKFQAERKLGKAKREVRPPTPENMPRPPILHSKARTSHSRSQTVDNSSLDPARKYQGFPSPSSNSLRYRDGPVSSSPELDPGMFDESHSSTPQPLSQDGVPALSSPGESSESELPTRQRLPASHSVAHASLSPQTSPTDIGHDTQPEAIPDTIQHYSGGRKVDVDEAYNILVRKDRKRLLSHLVDKVQGNQSYAMFLPGIQDALSQIRGREGREQIMVIDNFTSMTNHTEKVAKAARVISYFVKSTDLDEMDLYFASDTSRPRKYGVWEPGDDQVNSVIKQSIDRLTHARKPTDTLMFQFIRFGYDETGRKRLQDLDDKTGVSHRVLGEYDIVDTKHCDDHVPDILIGSISKFNDNKKYQPPANQDNGFGSIQR
ncbi:Fc.00g002190.m01.CDS01 [Cosmosporella sp. VM-42]